MSGDAWLVYVAMGALLLAGGLGIFRMYIIHTPGAKPLGIVYLVIAVLLVAGLGTAGVVLWRRQVSQQLEPEK